MSILTIRFIRLIVFEFIIWLFFMSDFPFVPDPLDHAETPFCAYRDILPVLSLVEKSIESNPIIYDPFYCNGAVVNHFQNLGFFNVINKCEDFWGRVNSKTEFPNHDILITNPPFSGDHIPRLLNLLVCHEKPFCLLLPRWVLSKKYWFDLPVSFRHKIIFCGPTNSPYIFSAPSNLTKGIRSSLNITNDTIPVKTGYFDCIWFCNVPGLRDIVEIVERNTGSKLTEPLQKSISEKGCEIESNSCSTKDLDTQNVAILEKTCVFSEFVSNIPILVIRPKLTPAERRWRKKNRGQIEETPLKKRRKEC